MEGEIYQYLHGSGENILNLPESYEQISLISLIMMSFQK